MKYLPYLKVIIVCLAMIILSLMINILLRHRRGISRWWRKRAIGKLIVNVILPFVIPLIMSVVTTLFSSDDNRCSCADCQSIFTKHRPILLVTWGLFALALINVVFQIIAWIKEHREEDIRWENAATRYAYNNMFRIFMDKNTRLRGAYHHGLKQGMLTDADIPYNVFSQIRTICWELCDTIGQITQIEKKDLSAAFIYHYCYDGATESDRQWRWITGKGSKFSITLQDYVELPNSTFRYMIHNSVSTLFYNDKKEAEANNQYMFSYRDNSHNRIGSFVAVKVAFSGNDQKLCEGIVMIHSYGYQFLDNMPRQTEEDLKTLILDRIIPVYRHLFQTELAMLYFRHETEPDTKRNSNNNFKHIRCNVEYNKTTWSRKRSIQGFICSIKPKIFVRKK